MPKAITESWRQFFPPVAAFVVAVCLSERGASAIAPSARPNIVVILCDDLGYGDMKCLNPSGKIRTPHMDRLAADGVIFTDAHSGSAVCTPTRYGLLTGRYAWRSRLKSGVLGGLSPRLIEPGRMTVASFLKEQGYATGCVGKWHLGMDWVKKEGKQVTELGIESAEQVHNVDYAQPYKNGPYSVGFDWYYGISASLDMVPYTFLENDLCTVTPTVDKSFPMMLGRPGQMTRTGPAAPDFDANQVLPTLTKKAVEFIDERAGAWKKEQHPFFLYVPLASPHTPIVPTGDWNEKSGLNPYGDFVMQTDAAIGEIVAAIDRNGVAKDTLVVVTSDNGCSPMARYDELVPKGHNPSYVFRGHKADIYEGGHRVPFLVRMPGKIPPGTKCAETIWLGDLFSTFADLVGEKLPDTAGEDSVSFLPALFGQKWESPRDGVVHHSINGSFAIRSRNWKLCLAPGSGGWTRPRPGIDDTSTGPLVQLFDLESDIGETRNIEAGQPEIVKRLTALLEKYVADGRSTPGAPQQNTAPVDIWKAGRDAHRPVPPKAK